MIPLIALMAACNPSSCVQVDVVDPYQDGATEDGGSTTDDTGDTGPIDTGPPPPCDVPEVEPNNPYAEAQDLPMEQWACGNFDDEDDGAEIFLFENEEAGWLRVWARAFEIGSLADITLAISSNDGPYGASRLSNPDSTDAMIVFPVDDDYEFYATLSEHYGRSGDAYTWELMASEVKAPIEWNGEESEDNDTSADANPIQHGDRIFGKMNTATDYDWYYLELEEGRSDIILNIEAWFYGSPADTRVELYKPSGSLYRADSYSNEGGAYNLDPYLTASPTEGGIWTVKILPEVDSEGNSEGGGGSAFWYVLDVSVVDGD